MAGGPFRHACINIYGYVCIYRHLCIPPRVYVYIWGQVAPRHACIYIYIYMCVYRCSGRHLGVYMYICIWPGRHLGCMHIYIRGFTGPRVYVCIHMAGGPPWYACMRIHMCVCVCIWMGAHPGCVYVRTKSPVIYICIYITELAPLVLLASIYAVS